MKSSFTQLLSSLTAFRVNNFLRLFNQKIVLEPDVIVR